MLLGEVWEADGVVENPVGAVVVGVGTANDADEREVLAVRAGDGVEDAEAPDGEGNDAGADAAGTGIAIGGVASVELVAAPDDAEARLREEMVEEGEIEIAGHGEDVMDADLDEAASHVAAKGGLRRPGGRDGREDRVARDGRR